MAAPTPRPPTPPVEDVVARRAGARFPPEPHDRAPDEGSRRVGLGLTAVVVVALLVFPVVWAAAYLARSDSAGLGPFRWLFAIVAVAIVAVGALVLLNVFRRRA